ncbi:Os01g0814100, partial [Oryza sativa Japonica Group]
GEGNGIDGAAAHGGGGGGRGRGGGDGDGGGADVAGGGAGAGGRDQPGVHGRGAQHVGLPDVRDEREHGAEARRAVLPGAGGAARVQARLPLPAARRRRQLVRHQRRLQARHGAPGHLRPRRAARHRMRASWSTCAYGAFCIADGRPRAIY